MNKKKTFRVLTPEQYERLTLEAKLAYIEEAMRVRKVAAAGPRFGRTQPSSKSPVKLPGRGRK